MRIVPTAIPDVCEVYFRRYKDERGWFAEMWTAESFRNAGMPQEFAQDNESFSRQGVLRGLHYQVEQPQGKLVRVVSGKIFDVAVDLRRGSATFGKHVAIELAAPEPDSAEEARALWIPVGFAHGFYVMSSSAQVHYKTTAPYCARGERTLQWDAPELGISWPLRGAPVLSGKDAQGASWADAEKF